MPLPSELTTPPVTKMYFIKNSRSLPVQKIQRLRRLEFFSRHKRQRAHQHRFVASRAQAYIPLSAGYRPKNQSAAGVRFAVPRNAEHRHMQPPFTGLTKLKIISRKKDAALKDPAGFAKIFHDPETGQRQRTFAIDRHQLATARIEIGRASCRER